MNSFSATASEPKEPAPQLRLHHHLFPVILLEPTLCPFKELHLKVTK